LSKTEDNCLQRSGISKDGKIETVRRRLNTYLFHKPFPPQTPFLLASGLTPQLYDWIVSSEHLGFLFSFSLLLFFVWFRAAD